MHAWLDGLSKLNVIRLVRIESRQRIRCLEPWDSTAAPNVMRRRNRSRIIKTSCVYIDSYGALCIPKGDLRAALRTNFARPVLSREIDRRRPARVTKPNDGK